GAQIAVDEINAAGGINGTQIEFNMQDDEHDAEKAVNAYNSLKDWGMQILLGTVTSTPCVAVVDYSKADNMFQLTPSASSTSVIEGNTNVFQVCFIDPNQGIGSAQYIGQTGVNANDGGMVSKVGVIYDSSDVYSSGIYTKFVEESGRQPYDIVASEAFTADSNTDFSVQLQKAKDAGAQLIFLPIYYEEAALILTQAAAMGYNPVFFGCDGLDGILDVDNFDTSLAEGLILLTPFTADADDAKTKAFVAEYQNRHGEIPNQFAANAYDAIYIIKTAIEFSDAKPGMSVSALGDAIISAMTQISVDGITGANTTWKANGEVNKAPKAMKIVGGVYVGL
ncbi:MAG: ABC transporter substrate-binding protein, partial [Lachnospiraceae bacterium]|nr:ABC transporter substrate-binding protein [Lachnospiraceae bacterium]